jgi:hypothetical protein
VGATGGDSATEPQTVGGREATSDLPSMDSNKEDCAHSLENSNEKQILRTILGKEVWDTKAAKTGQNQSHNRRCDFMELMHSRDQLAKADYPSDAEGDVDKITGENLMEDHMVGPEQDGLNSGPGVLNLGALPHVNGPELLIDPQMDGSLQLSGENKNEKHSLGDGSTRKWRRRVRSLPSA